MVGSGRGHMSPSGMQTSGIMQPMVSMGPGQLFMPSPQAMGGIGGQSAGKARAVERRAKSRRGWTFSVTPTSTGILRYW